MRRFKFTFRQALACCAACVSTAYAETITDLTGYIYQTATDLNSGASSFIHGKNWSDGNAPHGDADYIVGDRGRP